MSSPLAERLRRKHFPSTDHPYQIFARTIDARVVPDTTMLDAGCGRTAPLLRNYLGRAKRLIGVDVGEFAEVPSGIELLRTELSHINLPSNSVDLVVSRSVMEHLAQPEEVYAEIYRLLKPGGRFILLTPNFWDYGSLVARVVPGALHPWIVSTVEGRAAEDVFPTFYRSNTKRSVTRLLARTGFEQEEFSYLGQYPNYLMFSGTLFLVGTWYEKTLRRFRPLHWLRGWILAVARKPLHAGNPVE
jgi:SAM-dependent methyltransferase